MSTNADTHVSSPNLVQRFVNSLKSIFRKIKNFFTGKSGKDYSFQNAGKRKPGRKNTNVDAF